MERQQQKGEPGEPLTQILSIEDQPTEAKDIKSEELAKTNQVPNNTQKMGVYLAQLFTPTQNQLSSQFLQYSLAQNHKQSKYNPKHLLKELKSILFRGSSSQVSQPSTGVLELVGFWSEYDICDLYINEDVVGPAFLQYYNHWILTARVLGKLKQFFYNLLWKKLEDKPEYQGLDKIRKFLEHEELQFVYSRELFSKKKAKFSYNSYLGSNYATQYKDQKQVSVLQRIYQIAQQEKIQIIVGLFDFLAKIEVIELSERQSQIKNGFMNHLQNIKRQQQRQLLVMNYACMAFEKLKQLEEKGDQQFSKLIEIVLPNYMFYKNKKLVRSNKMNIQKLHQMYKDYDFLESVHDYIQWMFPNHYGSNFNSKSSPLNYIESELFLRDERVAISLFHSMIIFFDFMGLSFNTKSYKLQLRDKQRLQDVILVCMHNHLRIMRILACLSITGFREIALDLIDLLDKYTRKGELLQKERSQFQRSWQIYGTLDENKAKQMCFLQTTQFPKCPINWRQILQKFDDNISKGEQKKTQSMEQTK